MWNAADNLMRGRDKVHCHDEGETLAERRPVVVAPCSPVNVPLAFARHQLFAPDVAEQQHVG